MISHDRLTAIYGSKVKRDLNIADAGTHYLTKAAFKAIAARALNAIKDLVRSST